MRRNLCGYFDKGVTVTPAQITAIHQDLPWLHHYVPEYIPVRIQRADLEIFRSRPAKIHYTYDGDYRFERVLVVAQNGDLLYEVGKYINPPLWRLLFGFLLPELLRREETIEDVLKSLMQGPPNIRLGPVSYYIVACYHWGDAGSAIVYKPKKPATSLVDALNIALEQEQSAFEKEVLRARRELELGDVGEPDYAI